MQWVTGRRESSTSSNAAGDMHGWVTEDRVPAEVIYEQVTEECN